MHGKFSQAYHYTHVDGLWEYANLPEDQRISLHKRVACGRPDCKNLLKAPLTDAELSEIALGGDGKVAAAEPREHDDVTWVSVDRHFMGADGEIKSVVKQMRVTKKVMRPPNRLVCPRCRDILYCSNLCAKHDKKRHTVECDRNRPDILKCVINQDYAGVKLILAADEKQALRFFGTEGKEHSIWEFAVAIGHTWVTGAIGKVLEAFFVQIMASRDMHSLLHLRHIGCLAYMEEEEATCDKDWIEGIAVVRSEINRAYTAAMDMSGLDFDYEHELEQKFAQVSITSNPVDETTQSAVPAAGETTSTVQVPASIQLALSAPSAAPEAVPTATES